MRLQSACKGTEQTYHNPKLCVVLMRFLAKNSDFTPLFLGYGRIFGNLSLFYDRIFGIIINFALKKVINSKIHVIYYDTKAENAERHVDIVPLYALSNLNIK